MYSGVSQECFCNSLTLYAPRGVYELAGDPLHREIEGATMDG